MSNTKSMTELYERLRSNPDDKLSGLQLFHSSVGYAVAAVEALFNKRYSYEAMANLMVEENMLGKDNLPVSLDQLVTNLSDQERQLGFNIDTMSGDNNG